MVRKYQVHCRDAGGQAPDVSEDTLSHVRACLFAWYSMEGRRAPPTYHECSPCERSKWPEGNTSLAHRAGGMSEVGTRTG